MAFTVQWYCVLMPSHRCNSCCTTTDGPNRSQKCVFCTRMKALLNNDDDDDDNGWWFLFALYVLLVSLSSCRSNTFFHIMSTLMVFA